MKKKVETSKAKAKTPSPVKTTPEVKAAPPAEKEKEVDVKECLHEYLHNGNQEPIKKYIKKHKSDTLLLLDLIRLAKNTDDMDDLVNMDYITQVLLSE